MFKGLISAVLLLAGLLGCPGLAEAQPGVGEQANPALKREPSAPVPGRGAAMTGLAIWRLKPLGMDDVTAQRLEGLLRTEAGKIAGIRLQPRGETNRILAEQLELAACGGETACLCRIGQALGVQKLSTGVIGALGDDYTFDLKLIDIASCREERRINEALSGREDLLIGAIRQALYKLVAPALYVGSLSVTVPVAGATVEVDGKQAGASPLPGAITGLKPGIHRLRIVKQGFSAFAEEVPVRFQQTTRVKVDLVKSVLTGLSYEKEEMAKPAGEVLTGPVSTQVPVAEEMSGLRLGGWLTGGLAVAAAATAGILGWRAMVAEQELEEAASATRPYLNADHRSTYQDGKTFALTANILWGLAGAAAVTSASLFIVDLTSDGVEAESGSSGGNQLQLLPGLSVEGGGFLLLGRF